MTAVNQFSRRLSTDDFGRDSHAARYQGEVDAHPDAFRRLVELLNDPANEQRLRDAEMHGMPALAGVVHYVESDAAIAAVLRTGTKSHRFRQTVGVAVKLKMAKLGWATTGRKGTVKGAHYFTKSEHYRLPPDDDNDHAARSLAALDFVAQIGDDAERGETGRALVEALAASRANEGRVF